MRHHIVAVLTAGPRAELIILPFQLIKLSSDGFNVPLLSEPEVEGCPGFKSVGGVVWPPSAPGTAALHFINSQK